MRHGETKEERDIATVCDCLREQEEKPRIPDRPYNEQNRRHTRGTMAPTAVLLLLVSTFLLLEFSQANQCVAAGYGCVPARVCPRQRIKMISGCRTVCCDLGHVTSVEEGEGVT
ncbi:hypothetical protein HPB47_008376 [Ixodes persulcatus]|uniref:Uncharacterized protein n=1 Tax=Ixodes persulcatus TaxID=34615 RepID=A0AC60P550_IXOPE|nr:hypothetical protein HPB47_008376 [Ixodes persulcatus]